MSTTISLLKEIGFTNTDNLDLFLKGTRDNHKVNVLKYKKTGIYILDKIFTNEKYYNCFLTKLSERFINIL